jgi:hypothetical protein
MKQQIHIEADFDKPELLKSMVEKLVTRHTEKNSVRRISPLKHESLDTSSTEAYVSGTISMSEGSSDLKIHFDSSFLFTCIKRNNSLYEVTWSVSLS